MLKKFIVFTLMCIMCFCLYKSANATVLNEKITIPNTNVLTYDLETSNRLKEKFVVTLITNLQMQTILQEMARNNNVELQPFQYNSEKGIKFYNDITDDEKDKVKKLFKQDKMINGYYFYVNYKSSKKEDIINLSLTIAEFVMDKSSSISSVVGGILIPLLKDKVFKVSKFDLLKKFNSQYAQINTIMTEVLMQTYQMDIKNNPEDYGITKIILRTDTIIVPKNANVEIYAREVILQDD